MRKITVILIVILAVLLSFHIYSFAKQKLFLPRPEDVTGQEASTYLPQTVDKTGEKMEKPKPVAKGSADLKVTGPVWVEVSETGGSV